MDKQRAKIIIRKINSLFDSMAMEGDSISPIERDLMLKYIRDLYEQFIDEDAPKAPVKPLQKSTPPPPPPPKEEIKAPIIESKPMEQPKYEQPQDPPPKPEPKVEEKVPAPKKQEIPEPVYQAPQTSARGARPEIESLFSFKQAKELSEKLSEQPIRDLQAALSINDKLLYTNELFGRQHNILNDSLTTLNRFESMEEAKGFLMSLAEQYNWPDDEREEIARSFIKTIRRRYI